MINNVRGIKITMAGVGLDWSEIRIMTSFGEIGDSDIQFKSLDDASDISDMFEHVAIGIRQQRVVNVMQIGMDGDRSNALARRGNDDDECTIS